MMTLVPALAFGDVNYDTSASKITKVSKSSLKADRVSVISVQFRQSVEGENVLLKNSPVGDLWVKASRDGVEITVDKQYWVTSEGITKDKALESANVSGVYGLYAASGLQTDNSGLVKFNVTSSIAKPVTISFWSDTAGIADDIEYVRIGEATITFTADEGKIKKIVVDNVADTKVGDKITLTATVEDDKGNGLDDRLVVFYKKKTDGGSWIRIDSVDTDENGMAELNYYEETAGSYEIEARCTGKKSTDKIGEITPPKVEFTVSPGNPAEIEAVTADGKVYDVSKDGEVKFIVKDSFGNKITPDNSGKSLDELIELSFVSVPKDSDLEDEDVDYELEKSVTSDDELVVGIPFDEVGDYKLKARITGFGKYVTLTITAKEAGETEDITVKFAKDGKKSLIAGEVDGEGDCLVLNVKLVDEYGIELDADNYKVSSSDVSLVKIDPEKVDKGELTVVGPTDDKKRGVAKITVIDLDTSKTASIDVPVVGKPCAIAVESAVSGKTANVTLQFVDNDGAVTRANDDVDYEVLLPKGVVISEKKKFGKDSGEASFKATVEEYGEYDLTVVSGQGIAKKFTLVVGVPDSEKEIIGAKSITMFIGSSGYVQDGVAKITDVAPFIKDDRTFVAIRPVADAFGCEIGWDEVEQKVTLVRDDIVVTINIGSSDIEVVEDGVVSVVEADVPAFIEDGRTVLPFRAVGNAFGATVDYDEVTQSVTYTQS